MGTKMIHVVRNDNPPPLGKADPLHATVSSTDDTLEFLAKDDLEFAEGGIEFQSAQAPYTNRTVVNARTVTFTIDHDPSKAGIQWPYHITVTQGSIPFIIDPTVENEAPPAA